MGKCNWIVLYTVYFTAFCLGGRFFQDTVYIESAMTQCQPALADAGTYRYTYLQIKQSTGSEAGNEAQNL